jgi:hypothetical protein
MRRHDCRAYGSRMDPRSRPWTIRSTALAAGGAVCFLLYLPTASPFYVVLAVLLMVAATVAAFIGIRRNEE